MANPTIRILLKERGFTGGRIAQLFSVHRSAVYRSMDGRGSRRVRLFIARVLSQSPSFLWPDNSESVRALDDFYFVKSLSNGSNNA